MIAKKLFLLSFFTLHFSLFSLLCFSEEIKLVDSLNKELNKFHDYKKELGSKAIPLMDSTVANIYYELFKAWDGNVDSELLYCERLKSISERIGYKKGLGKYYNGLGLFYMNNGRNYPLAEENYLKALKIRTEIGDLDGVGWTYNNMGLMYGGEGNVLESIKSHTKAIKVREEIGDKKGMMVSLWKRSGGLAILGNYPEVLKDCFYALKLANEIDYKEGIAGAYYGIGGIYELEGNYNEALKYYIESSKIEVKRGDWISISGTYENLAKVYLLKGDTVEALKKYSDLSMLIEAHQLGPWKTINVNNNIGNINFDQGNYDEALKHFFVSRRVGEELKNKHNNSIVGIEIAKVYYKQDKYHEALDYLKNALVDARETGFKDGIKDVYKLLSDIYSKQNNFKAAYDYQIMYQETKDSILNIESATKMKQLDMQYAFDKDAAIQKAEQGKKDKEVEVQKFRRNAIYIGLVLVVFFLVVVIIQRTKLAREMRQKELALERSRISRDLHDDLGSGLISILMMSEQIQNPENKLLIAGNIEKIKQSSKMMVDQMRVIIWAMNSMNDTLENLLIYIESYARDYFENLPVKFTIHLPENVPSMEMSGVARRDIFLVVKEALNNITKHAQTPDVDITITSSGNSMNIVITDHGKGFEVNENRRFGNGLKNMKSRMKDINGNVDVQSTIGEGTRIVINFPVE